MGRMSDEQLYAQSPRFKELVNGGMDAGTARQTVENVAAQAAGAISGVARAASGARVWAQGWVRSAKTFRRRQRRSARTQGRALGWWCPLREI